MTRTLSLETRSDGMVEVVEIGEDEESEALMRELGWVRADVQGEGAKVFAVKLEVPAEFTPEIAEKLRAQGLSGSPGFTTAGELEVGTPPGRLFSEAVDALLPGLAKECGNGANANADAHVAAILTVMNARFGRRF